MLKKAMDWFKNLSITSKLVYNTFFILMMAVIIVMISIYISCDYTAHRGMQVSAPMIRELTNMNISNTLEAYKAEIFQISLNEKITSEDATRNNKVQTLAKYAKEFEHYQMLGVSDRQGNAITEANQSLSLAGQDVFERAKETGKFALSEPLLHEASKTYSYVLAEPYYDDGNFAGVVFGAVGIKELGQIFERVNINGQNNSYIINSKGKIIVSANKEDVENSLNLVDVLELTGEEKIALESTFTQDKGELETTTKKGKVMIEYSKVDTLGWNVYIVMEESQFNYFIVKIIFVFAIIIALIAVASVWGSSVVTKMFLKPLEELGVTIRESSKEITTAGNSVVNSSEDLAASSEKQASNIEEISASIEETTSMIQQTADGSRETQKIAEETRELASEGNEKMEMMLDNIKDIKKSSDDIAKIIKVIDDIAFQTNILALNAAVEAARAGEAGKGFAVVADEVRNLAQKSAEAAKETQKIIEENVRTSDKGVVLSKDVADSLRKISEVIEKVVSISVETAEATSEEAKGIEQISTAMKEIEIAVQKTAENAQSGLEDSQKLLKGDEGLREVISKLEFLLYGNDKR